MSKTFHQTPMDSAVADNSARNRQTGQGPVESNPATVTPAAKTTPDAHPTVVEDGEHGPRHARHPA